MLQQPEHVDNNNVDELPTIIVDDENKTSGSEISSNKKAPNKNKPITKRPCLCSVSSPSESNFSVHENLPDDINSDDDNSIKISAISSKTTYVKGKENMVARTPEKYPNPDTSFKCMDY